ncbi:toprim domain-containing protein [Pseudomonas sp. RP23018S]|uniref:DNA primase n=1 Tax=Pseudomonas sp. RP23018S TaxID=3096037 RepID=UPI002AC9FB6D|nr:toprim domain-containing protein [Pseudomonas sp. RP23018S]MDZ5605185.1 toprim domain-containing protein [Pseudomonas sp. RP23018S]
MDNTTGKAADQSLLDTAMKVSRIYFQGHIKADEPKAYLEKRKLSPTAIYKFQLGYAPAAQDGRGLVAHFSTNAVRFAARDAGVLKQLDNKRLLDFFRGRLMFPIRSHEGDLVGFAGRLLEEKEGAPKYMNTPETEIFHKGSILYGMHENGSAIRESREAVLVEGYMDVIAMADHGLANGLAPMGTALTPVQFGLILDSGVRKLTVCLDGDAAGQRAAERTLETIMEQYHPALAIFIATLPDNHDPDSYIRDFGVDKLRSELSKAERLDDYIHKVCTSGHRAIPSLEDQAEYITKMQPFLTQSSGVLYNALLQRTLDYTKLPRNELLPLVPAPAEQDSQISWDKNTALAARWLVNDTDLQQEIAAKLSGIKLKSLGLDELSSLAKQYLTGVNPTGLLFQFAKAHGSLSTTEITDLRSNWQSWMKRATVEESLKMLDSNPFSASAKHAIRHALR